MGSTAGVPGPRAASFQLISSAFSLRGIESVAQRSGGAGLHTEGRRPSCGGREKGCLTWEVSLFIITVNIPNIGWTFLAACTQSGQEDGDGR